jgi:uncharacterized membrane protein affecting hemolysin expression
MCKETVKAVAKMMMMMMMMIMMIMMIILIITNLLRSRTSFKLVYNSSSARHFVCF